MKEKPLVSVFITSYNQENFIEEAILSVVNQDYKNIQVVVSDDGSTDTSCTLLKKLAKDYPESLEIHLHQENRGSTWNHNYSYQQCRGEFICYFDGDDIMLPGKISKQVAFMQKNPEYYLSYHNSEIFDSNSNGNYYLWSERFGTRTGTGKDLIRYGNFLPASACMFRKSNNPIAFNQKITLSADWLFWIDLLEASKGRIGYINKVLGRYRRHDKNVTLNWKKKIEQQFVTLEIIEHKYIEFQQKVKKRSADVLLMKAIYQFWEGEKKKALTTLFESLKLFSPNILLVLRLPLREIIFFIKAKFKFDDLIKSLVSN